mgnify:CR=1 FL=1
MGGVGADVTAPPTRMDRESVTVYNNKYNIQHNNNTEIYRWKDTIGLHTEHKIQIDRLLHRTTAQSLVFD